MELTFERKVKDDRAGGSTGNCSTRYDIFSNGELVGAFEYFFAFAGFVIGTKGYKIDTCLNFPWFIPFTKDVLIDKHTGEEMARFKGYPFSSSIEFKGKQVYKITPKYTLSPEISSQHFRLQLGLNGMEPKISYHIKSKARPLAAVFYKQDLEGTIQIQNADDLILAFAGLYLLEIAIGNVPDRSSD